MKKFIDWLYYLIFFHIHNLHLNYQEVLKKYVILELFFISRKNLIYVNWRKKIKLCKLINKSNINNKTEEFIVFYLLFSFIFPLIVLLFVWYFCRWRKKEDIKIYVGLKFPRNWVNEGKELLKLRNIERV